MHDHDVLEAVLNSCTRDRLPVLYLSGPMSGMEDHNFPAFNESARRLRFLGFPVLNPADFGDRPALSWGECLARDLPLVMHCDIVVLLDGWEGSRGARLERTVAVDLGKPAIAMHDLAARVIRRYYTEVEMDRLCLLDASRQGITEAEICR